MPPTYRNQPQQNRPQHAANVEFQPGNIVSVPWSHSYSEVECSASFNAKVDTMLSKGYSYHSAIVLTPTSKLLIFIK